MYKKISKAKLIVFSDRLDDFDIQLEFNRLGNIVNTVPHLDHASIEVCFLIALPQLRKMRDKFLAISKIQISRILLISMLI